MQEIETSIASSAKRKRTEILCEEEVRELLDTSSDSDDGRLTDSDIDYSDGESEDDKRVAVMDVSGDAS